MSAEREVLAAIRLEFAALAADQAVPINDAAALLRRAVEREPLVWAAAITIIGAEMAAEEPWFTELQARLDVQAALAGG